MRQRTPPKTTNSMKMYAIWVMQITQKQQQEGRLHQSARRPHEQSGPHPKAKRTKTLIGLDPSPSPAPAHQREEEKRGGGGGGGLGLPNTRSRYSALRAETYLVCCSGGWATRTGGVLRHLTFRAVCGGQDPHLAALGHGKRRRSERLPCSKRAAEGVGFAAELAAQGRVRAGRACLRAHCPAG